MSLQTPRAMNLAALHRQQQDALAAGITPPNGVSEALLKQTFWAGAKNLRNPDYNTLVTYAANQQPPHPSTKPHFDFYKNQLLNDANVLMQQYGKYGTA